MEETKHQGFTARRKEVEGKKGDSRGGTMGDWKLLQNDDKTKSVYSPHQQGRGT